MKFLLAEGAANTGSATQWILPAVLLVLVIGIFILNYFRSKKSRENMQNMVNNIKVGDNVKTYSGFYGKIISITETTDGKVAVLQTGEEGNYGYLSIDMNAIYAIDEKKPVVLDADGNIIDPDAKPEETKQEEVKAEEKVEEAKTAIEEAKVEEVKTEETETSETAEVKKEKKPRKTTKKSNKKEENN